MLMRYIVRAIFTRFGIWLIIESEIYRCHTDVDSGVVFAEYGVDKVFHNNHRPCPRMDHIIPVPGRKNSLSI